MSEYKSYLLRRHVNGDICGCPICDFLDGDRDVETLTNIIGIMDEVLAEYQRMNAWLRAVVSAAMENLPSSNSGCKA